MIHTLTIELTDHVHRKMERIIEAYRFGGKSDRSLGVDTMHRLCGAVFKAYLGAEGSYPQIAETCDDDQLGLFGGNEND